MMADEQFSLVWNSFPSNLSSGLYSLLTDEHLVDVTLAAEGKILRAHKLVLSICSTFFRDLFKGNTCKHPIVILKDVNYRDLSAMLHFMYQGEVNIKQEDIASFLKVAETLQIKGLTKDKTENKNRPEDTSTRIENLSSTEDDNTNHSESIPPESTEKFDLLSKAVERSELDDSSLHQNNSTTDHPDEITSPSIITSESDNNYKQESTVKPMPFDFNEDDDPHIDEINNTVEPLDFTADTRQINKANDRLYNYTYGVGCSTSSAGVNSLEDPSIQSSLPSSEITSFQTDYFEEPPGAIDNNVNYVKDLPFDSSNQSKVAKGRRTVKGIQHSALPLETTLRVVSELGPTIRVEKGKVVRMYSCPWCLRHFTRKENLKLHVRYIHGPLESLTCKLCGNKYKNSNSLRVHSYLYHNTKRNKHSKSSLVMNNV
ncbi:zinc finger and BTB domain-containing protein 44-like [Chelonus insularis]|uniref:zinc finger and BTB domain-containing protein 44-like n=1 Tax=Chelonus insularis TaxID=460826 RepID=UPI00158F4485|nr:zinc finger and BTB domain-containing protein 44-like [Chelonus insularis]